MMQKLQWSQGLHKCSFLLLIIIILLVSQKSSQLVGVNDSEETPLFLTMGFYLTIATLNILIRKTLVDIGVFPSFPSVFLAFNSFMNARAAVLELVAIQGRQLSLLINLIHPC